MFELTTPTAAKLSTFTPRIEKHGDDDVSAITLGLTIIGPNTLLDALSQSLREALYTPVPGQEQLPGMPVHTPLRRTKDVESLSLAFKFEGWTLRIDYGADENDPLVLGGCKIDKFKLVAMEGGSIELSFRVSTNDIDEREGGILFGQMGHELSITISAPIPDAAAETIDGAREAFERDHPPKGQDERQATILDAMQAGPEPDDSEGDTPDGEPERGPAWPFPEEKQREMRAAAVAAAGDYDVKVQPPKKGRGRRTNAAA